MNKVCLVGRVANELDERETGEGRKYVKFVLAVDRGLSKEARQNAKQTADFIKCYVWGAPAETLKKYTNKGDRLGVSGRLQSSSYAGEDGKTVYSTTVTVDSYDFLNNKSEAKTETKDQIDFEDLPF